RGTAADYPRCGIPSGAAGYAVSAVFLELVHRRDGGAIGLRPTDSPFDFAQGRLGRLSPQIQATAFQSSSPFSPARAATWFLRSRRTPRERRSSPSGTNDSGRA